MDQRRHNLPLLFGLLGSVLLHLFAVVPFFLLAVAPRQQAAAIHVHYGSDEMSPPDFDPPPDHPALGIDSPTPSSLTWIGYDEYREHLAALEEFEQAAFTQNQTGELGEVETETPGPDLLAEQSAESAETTAEPTPALVMEPSSPIEPIESPAVETAHAEPVEMESIPAEAIAEAPMDVPPLVHSPLIPLLTLLEAIQSAPILAESPPSEREDVQPVREPEPQPQPQPPAPPMPSAQPAPAAASTARPAGEAADAADKDSPATSVIEVPQENWRLGKPLAAQGVELKPQRPQFSILQILTSSPGNPIVEIHFNRDGVPSLVTMLRSTGSESIDTTLIASLYRWRAAGDALQQLEGEQTLMVRIHLILTRRG